MSSSRSSRKNPTNRNNQGEPELGVPLALKNRKRSASIQSAAASESGEIVDPAPPKRIKKTNSASPEDAPMTPEAVDSKDSGCSSSPPPDRGLFDDTPTLVLPNKRSRRHTEKFLYMSKAYIEDRKANPRVQSSTPKSSTKNSTVRFTEMDVLPSSDSDSDAVVVKSEPQKDGDNVRSPLHGHGSAKGKILFRPPTPFDASDVECDVLPPASTQTSGNMPGRSLTPINVSSSKDNDVTPKASAKIIVSAKSFAKNKGSSRIAPHLTPCINLSKQVQKGSPKPNLAAAAKQHVEGSDSDELPASIISPRKKSNNSAASTHGIASLKPVEEPAYEHAGNAGNDIYLEDIISAPKKAGFSIEPFDQGNGPASCPPHLTHANDDGTLCPIELIAGAFDLFDGDSRQSILGALIFKELRPFVNVASVPRSKIYAEKYKHQVMWSGQNRSVIFTMLGSVQGCHLVSPVTIGAHDYRAIMVIPYGESWRKFQSFLGEFYGQGPMRGPFEYGCLLTLTSRRKGWSVQDASSSNTNPVTPKKNSRAFGGASSSSAEWFDAKIPNCVDFDKQIPIYDASRKPFLFGREDFVGMPSLPLYRKDARIADLPVDSIVSVFFSMASYSSKNAPSTAVASNNETLSMNLQYVIYYGCIPRED